MVKIELSNGYVVLRDFIDRKTSKAYRKALFFNSKKVEFDVSLEELKKAKKASDIDLTTGKKTTFEFDPAQIDEANDILVEGCVTEFVIDGKTKDVTRENFDALAESDFTKIADACNKMMSAKEQEKKR